MLYFTVCRFLPTAKNTTVKSSLAVRYLMQMRSEWLFFPLMFATEHTQANSQVTLAIFSSPTEARHNGWRVKMKIINIQPKLNVAWSGNVRAVAPLTNHYCFIAIANNGNTFLHCRLLPVYKIPFLDRRCGRQQSESGHHRNSVNRHWPKALVYLHDLNVPSR
ncbi:hypothetical protein [Alteromonas aestuariivivens]|uniref:hypothetical protein n=1 Tax=Alteromonas aestuariivivens TaxID=1938339 RepID=UPI0011C04D13|nr:hypothetical protein [Alteromonas aestuariivivens]